MNLRRHVVGQFRKPHGTLGRVAGWVMSRRASNRERNLWTLDLLEIEPGQHILEIGFGPGFAIEQMLERFPDIHVTGIDHSDLMFRQATQRNRRSIDTGQVELHCLPVESMDKLEGQYDRIFSSNVAQFWADREQVFQNIRARLKPGGRVASTYLPRNKNATDADSLTFGETLLQDMKAAGFETVALELGPRLPVLTVSAVGNT